MSDHTIVNLKELEDVVSARVPGIEGRFGRTSLESDHLGISLFRYGPGVRGSTGHHHREQEEAYIVIAGSGRIKLDDDIFEIDRLDAIRVAPEVTRMFEAGSDGLELLAFGPQHEGDGDLIYDWWTD